MGTVTGRLGRGWSVNCHRHLDGGGWFGFWPKLDVWQLLLKHLPFLLLHCLALVCSSVLPATSGKWPEWKGKNPTCLFFVVVVAQRSSAWVHCGGVWVFYPCGVASRQGSRNLRTNVCYRFLQLISLGIRWRAWGLWSQMQKLWVVKYLRTAVLCRLYDRYYKMLSCKIILFLNF